MRSGSEAPTLQLRDLEIGTRVTLRVKCIETLVQAVSDVTRVVEMLVADETACALCLTSDSHAALSPGSTVTLHDAAVVALDGRLVIRLDARSSVQAVAEQDRMLLVNLTDNISWMQRELVKM